MANQADLTLGTIFKAKGIEKFQQLLRQLRTELQNFASATQKAKLDQLGVGADKSARSLSKLGETTRGYGAAIQEATQKGQRFVNAMKEQARQMGVANTDWPKFRKTVSQVATATDNLSRNLRERLNQAIKRGSITTRQASREWSQWARATNLAQVSQKAFTGQIKATERGILNYAKSASSGTRIIKDMTVATDRQLASNDRFAKQVTVLNKALANNRVSYERAAKTMTLLNNKHAERVRRVQDSVRAAEKATRSTTSFAEANTWLGKQIGKVSGAFQRLGAAMKVTAAYGLAATAIFSLVNAFKTGVAEIVNYDQALHNLQAITGATAAEIAAMDSVMRQVASSTKFSTVEIADGMTLLGQAGLDAGESIAAIQAAADLATGTLTSFELVTDLLTTSIRAFGLNAVEASRVADVMGNAINKSKLTVDKLRIAFNFVGATAAQAGLSIEETAASMMVLANNGLRASTIGTGLRQVLSRLIAPNERLREAYQSQGVALDKINPKLVGWQEALRALAAVLWDTEKQTVDMTKAFQLFGLRGAQAAAVLVKAYVGPAFKSMLQSVYEVGTAAEMARIQKEGLAATAKRLVDNFKLLFVAIGDAGVGGALRTLAGIVENMIQTMTAFFTSGVGRGLVQMTGLTAAIMATVFALQLLEAAFTSAAAKATLMALQNPFIILAATIGATVLAVKNYLSHSERVADALVKEAVLTDRNVNLLEAYSAKLDDLNMRKEQGEKVDKQIEATLDRLSREYKELDGVLEINSEKWAENRLAIEQAIEAQKKIEIEKLVGAIKNYSDQIESAKIKTGIWAEVTSLLQGLWRTFIDDLIWPFEQVINLLGKIPSLLDKAFAPGKLARFAFGWTGLIDKVKEYYASLGEGSQEAAQATEKQRDAIKKLGQVYFDAHAKGKSLTEIQRELREEFGLNEEQIKQVMEVIGQLVEQSEQLKTSFDDLIKGTGKSFKQYYEDLDVLRQADFASAIARIDREVAAWEKAATDMGMASEEVEAVKTAKRAQGEAAYVESLMNEVAGEERASELKIQYLENYLLKVNQVYAERMQQEKALYDALIEAAKGNKEKREQLEKELSEKIKAIVEQRNKTIEAVNAAHLKALLDDYKSHVEKVRAANEEIRQNNEDLNDKLFDLEKIKLQKKYQYLDEERRQFKIHQEELRMEYERAQELVAKADEARRKALVTKDEEEKKRLLDQAKEYFEKSKGIFHKVAQDALKSANELAEGYQNAVKKFNMEEIARKAEESLKKVNEAMNNMVRQATEKSQQFVDKLKPKFEELKRMVEEIAQKPLTLKVDDQQLEGAQQKVQTVRKEIEKPAEMDVNTEKITEGLQIAKEEVDQWTQALKETKPELEVDVVGKGEPPVPIEQKLQSVNESVNQFSETLSAMKAEVSVNFTSGQEKKDLYLAIQEVQRGVENLKASLGAQSYNFIVNFVDARGQDLIASINQLNAKIREFVVAISQSHSVSIETAQAMADLQKVKSEINKLKGPHEIVMRLGQGIWNDLANLKQQISAIIKEKYKVKVKIQGEGSTVKPIMEKLEEVKEGFTKLKEHIRAASEEVKQYPWLIAGGGGAGGGTSGITEQVDQATASVQQFSTTYRRTAEEIQSDPIQIEADTSALDDVKSRFLDFQSIIEKWRDAMTRGVTDSLSRMASFAKDTNVHAQKWARAFEIRAQRMMDDFYYRVRMIKEKLSELNPSRYMTREERRAFREWQETIEPGGRFQFGGIVPRTGTATVEEGEAVTPSQSVRLYGQGIFEALRRQTIAPEAIQALLDRREAGERRHGSDVGRLHTIDLRVNQQSHTVYAERPVMDSLIEDLKRMQLVQQ